MVSPITGPFVTTGSGFRSWFYKKAYRQKPPFNLSLPYDFYNVESWGEGVDSDSNGYYYHWEGRGTGCSAFNHPSFPRISSAAANQAYERLKSKISDSSGWAENLAQLDKTRRSLVERCVQVKDFALAVKKGRFGSAARILRTPVPSGVSHRKAAARNFLEYEYGWKPLVSDIDSSIRLLTGEPPFGRYYASARESYTDLYYNSYTTGVNPVNSSTTRRAFKYDVMVRVGCTVQVTSPNDFLLWKFGVLDPALPWKLIPFSFVVDWFVNAEQVISSLSDWYGLSLSNPYTTFFAKSSQNYSTRGVQTYQNGYSYTTVGSTNDTCVEMRREGALPTPTLLIKPFKGFSVERGAQALSLVLSVLGR